MFTVNDDLSIYVTRGDMVYLKITADDNGKPYTFRVGDVVRFKVFAKKNCKNVVLQKDFPITEIPANFVEIILEGDETKFDGVINKPTDYWYEVELNPYDNPRTIIGYDEEGPRVFRIYPEGKDNTPPAPKPEEIKAIDDKLDMTSERPVQNQAIARAFESLRAGYKATNDAVAELNVTPQMFGAVGDGATDDTEAFKLLSEYITDIFKNKGVQYEIRIPGGTYRLTDTWYIPKSRICGYGAKLLFDCHEKTLIDFISSEDDEWCYGVIIEGLEINTTETNNHTNLGIDMHKTSRMRFRNVSISNCNIGINYAHASMGATEHLKISDCNTAIFIDDKASTLCMKNCYFINNNTGFQGNGEVVSVSVSDSYFENQDVDVLVSDVTRRTNLVNIEFERINIVKANSNKTSDTYVLYTINSDRYNNVNANIRFTNCYARFTPDNRRHYFAKNDGCDSIIIESQNNRVDYTDYQSDAVIFETVNNEAWQFVVNNKGFIYDGANVDLYRGAVLRSGIDESNVGYSLVRGQLTFEGDPYDPKENSLYLDENTLRYKNANHEECNVAYGVPTVFEDLSTTDLETMKNSFNGLLAVLRGFNIIE